jgi:hypothetical protein
MLTSLGFEPSASLTGAMLPAALGALIHRTGTAGNGHASAAP